MNVGVRWAEEAVVEVVTLLPLVSEPGELLLPGWVWIFVEALRRRVPVKLILVDVISLKGFYMVLRYGGRLPIVIVNGRKVPSEIAENPEVLAEQAYKTMLEISK
jgi:hypothetical protein